MAIQNLGSFELFVGRAPREYGDLDYDIRRSYAIYLNFESSNFASIFSYVRLWTYVKPNGLPPLLLSDYADIQIMPVPQIHLVTATRLFDNDGTLEFFCQRRSYYVGGGDTPDVRLTITYDDQISGWRWR